MKKHWSIYIMIMLFSVITMTMIFGCAVKTGTTNPEKTGKPKKPVSLSHSKDDYIIPGLIWLAKHQNPDGSWGARTFQNQCHNDKCDGIGDEQLNIGLTGLALLAFTCAGYTINNRDIYDGICFGHVVTKAALYLLNIQLSDGTFGGVKDGKFMYNQAIATYALADLYVLTSELPGGIIFKEPVEKAVKYLLNTQNPGKAWRYQPKNGQSDTSITGWVAMALKSAEDAGITIPSEAYAGIKSFYDDVTDPSNGKVGYTELGSIALLATEDPRNTMVQPSLTASANVVRIRMDKKISDPLMNLGVNQIISNLPAWDTTKPGIIDYYYWFWATYFLNGYDGPSGPNWTKWKEPMFEIIVKNQHNESSSCIKGSWDPIDRWSIEGSRIYSTAINVLTLECYCRTLCQTLK